MTDRRYVIDEMISAKSIAARIETLCREIQREFNGTNKLTVVGLLRGSFVFIADLVRELDLPFRRAHHVTGAAVKRAEGLGVDLGQLSLEELQKLEPGITDAVYKVLTPEASCASRQSFGGTAPEQVRARVSEWKARLS